MDIGRGAFSTLSPDPEGATSDRGFSGTTFSERSFVRNFKCFHENKHFAVHLLSKGRSFLAHTFVNTRGAECVSLLSFLTGWNVASAEFGRPLGESNAAITDHFNKA
jgi:uncharacterized protein (DUF1810 family)